MDTPIELIESLADKVRKFFHTTDTEHHKEALVAMAEQLQEQGQRIKALESNLAEIKEAGDNAVGVIRSFEKNEPEAFKALVNSLKEAASAPAPALLMD